MYNGIVKKILWYRLFCLTAICMLGIILAGGSISGFAKQKKAAEASGKCYTSIPVEKGDTLWSIASEHMTPEYGRIEDYISEIRSLNHLYDDGIYAGGYLIIPQY